MGAVGAHFFVLELEDQPCHN